MKATIEALIKEYEAEDEEIAEIIGDDFNPCDASGGNFDDAYYMGREHGEVEGALRVLYKLRKGAK